MADDNPLKNCKKKVYEYTAPWNVFSLAMSNTPTQDCFRLAVGSYIEKYENSVHVIQLDSETDGFQQTASIQHAYPTTKVQWAPSTVQREGTDVLATVGDYLRLWDVPTSAAGGGGGEAGAAASGAGGGGGGGSSSSSSSSSSSGGSSSGAGASGSSGGVAKPAAAAKEKQKKEDADIGEGSAAAPPVKMITRPKHLFDSNKTKNSCTPLTNMDWNPVAKNVVGCCCIDPICTIWDVEAGKIQSKILAHGSSVYDIQFKPAQQSIFATVGADGSLRLFDLRNLMHSAIVFETEEKKPLLRLDWNHRSNKIAILDVDGQEVNVIDLRHPMKPLYQLKRHAFPVNAVAWAPHSEIHIATAGEDMNAFIWNLQSPRFKESGDPLLEYCSRGCINNMVWSQTQSDWLSIAFDDTVQSLLV